MSVDKLQASDMILASPNMSSDPHRVLVGEFARLDAAEAHGEVCTRLGGLGERAG